MSTAKFSFGPEIQVVPFGEFPHPEGVVQVIDGAAADRMMENFRTRQARGNFAGLLVDFDHFSYDQSKSSEAAGWITGLVRKGDGLYANVRWTPEGEHALAGGRYRMCSPVFTRTEPLGGQRVRPVELDTVALTNSPNIKTGAPLSNRIYMNRSFYFPAPAAAESYAAETAPLDVPRQAGMLFSVLCNREQAARKCSFDTAWNETRALHPELVWLMGEHHEESVPPALLNRAGSVMAAAASRKCGILANRIISEDRLGMKLDYGAALRQVQAGEPKLYEAMKNLYDLDHISLIQELSPAKVHARAAFVLRAIRERLPDKSFESVWTEFKETQRELYTQMCLLAG